MGTKNAPAFLLALGLVAGALLAAFLPLLPGAKCVWLTVAGLASRRPWGRFVAFVGLGLTSAQWQWIEPLRSLASLNLDRPVEVVARVHSHPVRQNGEVRLRVRTRWIDQGGVGGRRFRAKFDLFVTLPETSQVPAIGDELGLKGYLRRSSGFANTGRGWPGVWRMRLKSASFLQVERAEEAPWLLSSWTRKKAEQALTKASPTRSGGLALVRALLLGDRSELTLAWQQVLRRLGLAHLLAVSGLHVGLLATLVYILTLAAPRAFRYLAMLVAVGGYLLLIGPGPAILRATVMALLGLTALWCHRPPQALNAVSWGACGLVLASPSVVLELGFQLSFVATLGLILLTPVYSKAWRRLPIWLRQPLAASVAAQLVTLPILLPYTGGCHPLAPLWNLLGVPWLALFLLLAFPYLLLMVCGGAAGAVLASWLLPALDLLTLPLLLLARHLPPTALDLRLIGVSSFQGAALALLLALVLARPGWTGGATLLVMLLATNGDRRVTGHSPELIVFDVGQGDAILLRDGSHALLVDGGGWRHGDLGGRVLLPALAAAGVHRVDAVLMTHDDLDHCGGLADLVRYLPVAEVWTGPVAEDSSECARRLLSAPGPRHRVVGRGDRFRLGRWKLAILHPGEGQQGGENDQSVVIMAEWLGTRVLLTGDIEAASERALVRDSAAKLGADVLKVAHHGSKTSTTAAWLAAVKPRIALISAGPKNRYGHPTQVVLDRLREKSVRVLRTDLSGVIRLRFEADGRVLFAQGEGLPW